MTLKKSEPVVHKSVAFKPTVGVSPGKTLHEAEGWRRVVWGSLAGEEFEGILSRPGRQLVAVKMLKGT